VRVFSVSQANDRREVAPSLDMTTLLYPFLSYKNKTVTSLRGT
jgi:hypothetical protein